jgi:hypothetical protein
MWFLSAKVAEARGQIEKTMQILEDIVDNHSQEKTPGFQVPAGVSASLWLGRLARENGKPDVAVRAFSEAARTLQGMPEIGFLALACNMYVAEVEADTLDDKKKAARIYEQIASAIVLDEPNRDSSPERFYTAWARWKLAELDSSKPKEPCTVPLSSALPYQLLALNGILASPTLDFYLGPRDSRRGWRKRFMDESLAKTKSKMDREAIYLTTAWLQGDYEVYADALAALDGISEDSFFATIASEERQRIQALLGNSTSAGGAASTAPPASSVVAQSPATSAPSVVPPAPTEPATTAEPSGW